MMMDSDIDLISFTNTLTTACFSLATGFAMFALGIFVNIAIQPPTTKEGADFVKIILGLSIGLTLLFIAVGTFAFWKRSRTMQRIKTETTHD